LSTIEKGFSQELKELIKNSREVAISLGFNYISTLHFFIADCESNSQNSIMNFAFKNLKEFEDFKKNCENERKDYLDSIDESLLLTVEAEKAIRKSVCIKDEYGQIEIYPCHLFIGALLDKESVISKIFKPQVTALDNLRKYYESLGEFDKHKQQNETPFLKNIFRSFKK
jgi:ATP-dependent Clp protease ATP-binding subunit ClpA